jgi:hypothetical protein
MAVMLVLLMEGIYEVRCWDGLKWHDIHNKVSRRLVQVLREYQGIFNGSYSTYRAPGLFFSSVIIFYTNGRLLGWVISPSQGPYLHTGQHKRRINAYTFIPWGGFEPPIPEFQQARTVHALDCAATVLGYIKVYLSNFKGCNVGITDWKDLWSTQLRWIHVAWYTYKIPWRLVQVIKQY